MDRIGRLASVLIALLLVVASCSQSGSSSTTEVQSTSEGVPSTTADVSPSTGPETETSSEPVVCHNPAPTEIGLGASHEGDNSDDTATVCFWVEVPDGLASLSFELNGFSANLDLAVGYGFARTLLYNDGEFWASRSAENNPELIEIVAPNAGPYFIKVGPAGLGEASAFSLLVSTTPELSSTPTGQPLPDLDECGGPATVLSIGDSASGEIVDDQADPLARSYYCVEVSAGKDSLTIELTGLTGLLDLSVQRADTNELWTDRSRGDTLIVTIEAPEPAAYYIDIAAALPGASSGFTLTVSG